MTKTPRPTDAELALLRVLWERGPSTVRQVHDVVSEGRTLAYTTTLKLLQIMTEKGLVRRQEQGRSHLYQPRFGRRGNAAPARRRSPRPCVRRIGGEARAAGARREARHTARPARDPSPDRFQNVRVGNEERQGERPWARLKRWRRPRLRRRLAGRSSSSSGRAPSWRHRRRLRWRRCAARRATFDTS